MIRSQSTQLRFVIAVALAGCAGGQRVDRPATTTVADAGPLLGAPIALSNFDAGEPQSDASATQTLDVQSTTDASSADASPSEPERWRAAASFRPALDRHCDNRGQWVISRNRTPNHGYGVGPGNLSRWRFAARRPAVWTAQPMTPLLRESAATAADTQYAAQIEAVLERAAVSTNECFAREVDDPSRPAVSAGFIHTSVMVQPDGTARVSLLIENDSLRSVARCVAVAIPRQLPARSASDRPMLFERVLGVCGSTRPPTP